MTRKPPVIAVLGASGLIGEAVARGLRQHGLPVVPVARRYSTAQRAAFPDPVLLPVVDLSETDLRHFLESREIDIVVNCIGVLQDSRRSGSAADVHAGFVSRLTRAMADGGKSRLLVHVSVPGRPEEDRTDFSRTKREAERHIAASAGPFVILRPGFVVANAAFGGSALIRALAMLPVDIIGADGNRPFAATDVRDIVRTIVVTAEQWSSGRRDMRATFDVMERRPNSVRGVVECFRRHLGGPDTIATIPSFASAVGSRLGDLAARLGWSPPIRSTALAEMRRGVTGDPSSWIAATGIEPTSLNEALDARPATVQDRWFARLYLLKGLILALLAIFWIVSGAVSLLFSFEAASGILSGIGLSPLLAKAVTITTSFCDIAIGGAIAYRRTAKPGLLAGIALSISYLASAAVLTPALWLDPVGSLVKTIPVIVLMLVALALLDDR